VKPTGELRGTSLSAEEVGTPIDLLKRFTRTPLEVACEFSGVAIRVATNSDVMSGRLRKFQGSGKKQNGGNAMWFWKIVVESECETYDEYPNAQRMNHGGLAFVRIGHRSFLACDRRARQGISFIAENLATNDRMFRQYFLPALMSLLDESIESSL
jgi:hypothetical protein